MGKHDQQGRVGGQHQATATQEPQDERFLTLSEVAALVDKTTTTVGRWCEDGLLDCVRMPSGLRAVPLSEVRKFLGGTRLAAKLAKLNGNGKG